MVAFLFLSILCPLMSFYNWLNPKV